jgi:DNA-binding transcriptional LysR family regulator
MELYEDIEILISLEKALGPLPSIGEYDVAFRSGKLVDSSAISRTLFKHEYVVCASPQYLKKRGVPKTLDDLQYHNCIDCRRGFKGIGNTWTFFDGEEHFDIPVSGNIYTDNALLIRHLALNHSALIYSPSFLIADDINAGRLVPVLTQYKTIENSIYVIHPYSKKNIPNRIKTFIEFVFANVKVPTLKS